MLSIRSSSSSTDSQSPESCTLNLLPCRIAHTGPCNASPKHWSVETNDKGPYFQKTQTSLYYPPPFSISHQLTGPPGTQIAHFRGRKLVSTPLALPKTHTGAVLNITDELLPTSTSHSNYQTNGYDDEDDEDGDGAELPVEVKAVDQLAQFDTLSVWGHEVQVDATEDTVLRGVEEWVALSAKIHGWDEDEEMVDVMGK